MNKGKENSKLLYVSGEPVVEPVAAKGNILMNTQAEKDYVEGRFGQLNF
ncbi:MAG TPA: pirin-like C-terminal cupin domain-containing protein [Flavisolibacter sp.]|nr:pirin-like C-terminal cupin domain-containing protein [Flavisolibacter sp.]